MVEKTSKPLVVRIDFNSLPNTSEERVKKLEDNDALLRSMIDSLATEKYTLMYTTTPLTDKVIHNTPSYEPVFETPLHMDLRRQSVSAEKPSNDTIARSRQSLFDRYQFFTPG